MLIRFPKLDTFNDIQLLKLRLPNVKVFVQENVSNQLYLNFYYFYFYICFDAHVYIIISQKYILMLKKNFSFYRYPNSKDIAAILELHLRDSLKGDRVMIESWITQMVPVMLDAFRSIKSSHGTFVDWTPKDLILWADSLKYYPSPEDESNITRHLLDAGRRMFHPRYLLNRESFEIST